MNPSLHIGHSRIRKEGRAKVTGAAQYTDDVRMENLLYGVTVRSSVPRGILKGIEFGEGIPWDEFTIVTAKDVPGDLYVDLIEHDQPFLALDRINHPEEPVVLLAHADRYLLEKARAAVRLVIEPLPQLFDLEESLACKEVIWGQDNLFKKVLIEKGDVDSVWDEAAHIIEGEYRTGSQEQLYIEPNGAIAVANAEDGVTVWGSLQCPYYVHKALKCLFNLPDDKIRVIQMETGGGFGGKEDYPSLIAGHAALLSLKAGGRPVKIIYDREEDMVATTKRHPSRTRIRSAFDAGGHLLALDIDFALDGGAYLTLTPVVLSRGAIHAGGPYRCPNTRIRARAAATNTPPHGAFRGFGAPQSLFAVERQMDKVARTLGLDPFTVRSRNAYREGDKTPTGQILKESVSAHAVLERAKSATRFTERYEANEVARQSRKDDGKPLRGLGLTLFWHGSGFTGNGERRMMSIGAVRLRTDLKIEVLSSSTDFGQGTEGIFRQIVADACGVKLDDVVVHIPDTAAVPNSGPTVASRTVMVVGGLLARAGAQLAQTLCTFAAHRSGIPPAGVLLRDGFFETERGRTPFAEIAQNYVTLHGPLDAEAQFEPTPGSTFNEETYEGDAYAAYGWGANVVEIEIDPDTFMTRITKLTTVSDVGHVVHPVMCAGQVEGGTLQALAWGYLEEIKMKDGRYLNDRLQTYLIPTLADTPDMETILIENPTIHGPFGAKGVGELPMDGGAPALLQAIENATGLSLSAIPATPERIFEASQSAGNRS